MNNTKILFPLYVLIFFGYLGYSLFITIFTPLFLQTHDFFSETIAYKTKLIYLGFALFLYPFGQFISSPILGSLSDRYGRRPILLSSLLVCAFFYASLGIAVWTKSLALLFISLWMAGLAEGNITLVQSAITDVSSQKDRGKYFGYVYAATAFSYLIGPILGGKLAAKNLYYLFSFQLPFFVVSILLLILVFWIYFVFEETLVIQKRIRINFVETLTNIKNVFTLKKVRIIFFVNFFAYLSVFGFFQTFPILLVNKFDLDVNQLSWYIAWTSVPFAVVNIWVIKFLTRKFDDKTITITALILLGVFLAGMLLPISLSIIWFFLFVIGGLTAVILPITTVIVSHDALPHEQGKLLGLNQSLQFSSEAFAGLLVGFLSSIFIKLAFVFFGFISLFAAIVLFSQREK